MKPPAPDVKPRPKAAPQAPEGATSSATPSAPPAPPEVTAHFSTECVICMDFTVSSAHVAESIQRNKLFSGCAGHNTEFLTGSMALKCFIRYFVLCTYVACCVFSVVGALPAVRSHLLLQQLLAVGRTVSALSRTHRTAHHSQTNQEITLF